MSTRLRDLHDRREASLAEVLAAASGAPPGDITPRAAALLGPDLGPDPAHGHAPYPVPVPPLSAAPSTPPPRV
ncbi:hypothetical protein ACIQNI_19970 [Streptomyces sp. NPDC091266]|uniref:hypothetical protein n=1 Tax=Streptomyces sp. NPDC091266 TaxID=3365978 RepID=UPI00382F7AAD